jgi:flavin-dependent dehydrogenase
MAERTFEIAVIGAGPAGSHLASRIASGSQSCVLFDPKGAWEKPCGGGVPTRAIREFSYLFDKTTHPRKLVRRITMISPLGRRVTLSVERPFAIYSRRVLNGLVLDRAIEAGAEFVRASVTDFFREGDRWVIKTGDGGRWRARFIVGADGAASFTRRRLVGIFPKQDLALAFGYNVTDGGAGEPLPCEEVIVAFPKDFTGYLWAFPRPGVMNFGVASKLGERTSEDLRALLGGFVRDYYGGRMPEPERMSFFGAKIPTLDLASWKGLKTTGEGWALVGDAAGFADPITGEGIYYAFKSADLLAAALDQSRDKAVAVCGEIDFGRASALYERLWKETFGRELEHASYRLPQFYHGRFMGRIFTDAMIMLARHHRGVRTILVRALTGEQSYVTLKRDLIRRALQVF